MVQKPWKIKGFGSQGSIFRLGGIAPQGLCRLFLFTGFFLFCLRFSGKMDFSNKVKDNIYFLIPLTVYLFRCVDYDFLHELINDSRR